MLYGNFSLQYNRVVRCTFWATAIWVGWIFTRGVNGGLIFHLYCQGNCAILYVAIGNIFTMCYYLVTRASLATRPFICPIFGDFQFFGNFGGWAMGLATFNVINWFILGGGLGQFLNFNIGVGGAILGVSINVVIGNFGRGLSPRLVNGVCCS